jgi:hypothetical protein
MNWLFDAADFLTRDHCGPGWTPALTVVNQVANFAIFVAYFSIPWSLLILWMRLRRMADLRELLAEHAWVLLAFGVFICSCGLGHLDDVLVFQWAPYRFFTLVNVVTAAASLVTALLLPRTLVRLLEKVSSPRGQERG